MLAALMLLPPQSLHVLLTRLCSQMEAPPQSLHTALRFLCSQMLLPPQSSSIDMYNNDVGQESAQNS